MDSKGMLLCVEVISSLLPRLRDVLNLTQAVFSSYIGISRQTLIEIEHQQHKIARPILISMVSYFSLRKDTAQILLDSGLYDIEFVNEIGFTTEIINMILSKGDGIER